MRILSNEISKTDHFGDGDYTFKATVSFIS